MNIENFSSYYYKNNEVRYIKDDKLVTPYTTKASKHRYKLRDNAGNWKNIAVSSLKALAGDKLELPADAVPVYNSSNDYFICRDSTIYSFNANKQGTVLKPQIGTNGYYYVNITYNQEVKSVNLHKLVAETFIMKDYTSAGLVCMHKDNDKTNCHVDNLCIGTYSQNNKDAYADGLNPGNGLKKQED